MSNPPEWLFALFFVLFSAPFIVTAYVWYLDVRIANRERELETDYYRGWLKYLIDKEERALYGDKKAPIQPPPLKHPVRTK